MVQGTPNNRPNPGQPGEVKVIYVNGLHKGCILPPITVGDGGKGGAGGFPLAHPSPTDISNAPNQELLGASGGGRENDPLIHAVLTYRDACQGNIYCPLGFTVPGEYITVEWPYETSTATVMLIGAGGGGQGGTGYMLPGGEGEIGGAGAVFVFPTYLTEQRRV